MQTFPSMMRSICEGKLVHHYEIFCNDIIWFYICAMTILEMHIISVYHFFYTFTWFGIIYFCHYLFDLHRMFIKRYHLQLLGWFKVLMLLYLHMAQQEGDQICMWVSSFLYNILGNKTAVLQSHNQDNKPFFKY